MANNRKTRTRRTFTVQEKLKAVLLVWTERRTRSEICQDMNLTWSLLDRWQNQAMEGMLGALESKKKDHAPILNSRLEKLLEKKLSLRKTGFQKLEDRLETVQRTRKKEAN